MAFFFSFTKFFKVWLQRKQLEFYRFADCFSMQAVTMWCFGFGLGRKSASRRSLAGKGTKVLIAFSIIVDILGMSTGLDEWRILKG